MWIGVYEFMHCMDVPWRVVLNECIELAKEFGGTDGHKYVNAVLNGLAPACVPTKSLPTKRLASPAPKPQPPKAKGLSPSRGAPICRWVLPRPARAAPPAQSFSLSHARSLAGRRIPEHEILQPRRAH